MILAAFLLMMCLFTEAPQVRASTKATHSRAISIVFDNSGSMYTERSMAWCRATYAMEVFASMLNPGDTLQIHPMHPISVDGQNYTMDVPYRITDAQQASKIRDIFTPAAFGTPIESIDSAAQQLKMLQADKKYLVILTDGGVFSRYGSDLDPGRTREALDKRIQENAGKDMTVMYLGIGGSACIPSTEQSEYFAKRQAIDSADVLSTLTEMCNLIFGRDTLPKSNISGNTITFDITMSNLIVFVQGENIENLRLTGGSLTQPASIQQTRYSEKGAGNYKSASDPSLQGMMVTYTDCPAGTYTIEYSGTATSVEVYYEPDADLNFVFTDAAGRTVDPYALYGGDYKVSFGMVDGQTGQMVASELLGNPHYEGSYSISGKKFTITYDGYSGEIPVTLNTGDYFDATLTATYLSGYTITKDTSDFGWPEGGIQVAHFPDGELILEISGGASAYSLQDLDKGTPFIAKVYYNGTQITGEELKSVDLKWEPDLSNAEVLKEFSGDHYKLTLDHKDLNAPQNTQCGECTVTIYAFHTQKGFIEAQAELTYNIVDDFTPLQMEVTASEDYIVISQLDDSQAIIADLKMKDVNLNPEDFASVELVVDSGGIAYTLIPNELTSSYQIKLLSTEGLEAKDYTINVVALYTDHIGRVTQVDDSVIITLSHLALWIKAAFAVVILIVILILLWIIAHIKVLPKYAHTTKKLSSMTYDGEIVTQAANFTATLRKNQLKSQCKYGGKTFGVSMDVAPGKESYLCKPQKRRTAEVRVPSVKKFGPAKIQEAMIGSAKYVADETTGKLVPALPNQKPFTVSNGTMIKYSGIISDGGVDKDFEVTSKLNFNK